MADFSGYDLVDVKRFGGLQLSTDAGDVPLEAAIAGNNFDLAVDRSFVRSRDGATRLGSVNAITAATTYRLVPFGSDLLVISDSGSNSFLSKYTTAGAVTSIGGFGLSPTGAVTFHDAVVFGVLFPSLVSYVFITSGSASGQKALQRYDTAGGLTASVGEPKYVAVATASNRLVQGWYGNGGTGPAGLLNVSTKSTVFFSDENAPEVFQDNNYVVLRPGDNEELRGLATWRDQTFAFKESTAFIFYGESIGPDGASPEFNYRALTLNGRIPPPSSTIFGPMVAVGAAGVYYLALDGVYRTTGGPPVKISGALDVLFNAGTLRPHSLSVVDSQVFVHTATGLYVYDEDHGQWTARSYGGYATNYECPMVAWPTFSQSASGDPSTLLYAPARTLMYTKRGATTDDGTAIVSSYQSGFDTLGARAVKTVRQSAVWGTGSITYSMGFDYGAPDAGTPLALGVAPATLMRMERRARRGTAFAFKLAAASGAWQVDSVTLMLRPTRAPGAKPS